MSEPSSGVAATGGGQSTWSLTPTALPVARPRIRWDTRGEAAEPRPAADQRNPVLDDVQDDAELPFVCIFSVTEERLIYLESG
jgi:hypothetical protein